MYRKNVLSLIKLIFFLFFRCIIKLWTKLPELVIKNQSSFEILKDSSIEILSTPLQRLNFIPHDEVKTIFFKMKY